MRTVERQRGRVRRDVEQAEAERSGLLVAADDQLIGLIGPGRRQRQRTRIVGEIE